MLDVHRDTTNCGDVQLADEDAKPKKKKNGCGHGVVLKKLERSNAILRSRNRVLKMQLEVQQSCKTCIEFKRERDFLFRKCKIYERQLEQVTSKDGNTIDPNETSSSDTVNSVPKDRLEEALKEIARLSETVARLSQRDAEQTAQGNLTRTTEEVQSVVNVPEKDHRFSTFNEYEMMKPKKEPQEPPEIPKVIETRVANPTKPASEPARVTPELPDYRFANLIRSENKENEISDYEIKMTMKKYFEGNAKVPAVIVKREPEPNVEVSEQEDLSMPFNEYVDARFELECEDFNEEQNTVVHVAPEETATEENQILNINNSQTPEMPNNAVVPCVDLPTLELPKITTEYTADLEKNLPEGPQLDIVPTREDAPLGNLLIANLEKAQEETQKENVPKTKICKWITNNGSACEKAFVSEQKLMIHVKMKHTGKLKLKNLTCGWENCKRTTPFSKRKYIVSHVRIHTGDKPFRCFFTDCAKVFRSYNTLREHENTHIAQTPPPLDLPDVPESTVNVASDGINVNGAAFRCLFGGCGLEFPAAEDLRLHVQSHTKFQEVAHCAPPKKNKILYPCSVTGCKRMLTKRGLRRHLRTHNYEQSRVNKSGLDTRDEKLAEKEQVELPNQSPVRNQSVTKDHDGNGPDVIEENMIDIEHLQGDLEIMLPKEEPPDKPPVVRQELNRSDPIDVDAELRTDREDPQSEMVIEDTWSLTDSVDDVNDTAASKSPNIPAVVQAKRKSTDELELSERLSEIKSNMTPVVKIARMSMPDAHSCWWIDQERSGQPEPCHRVFYSADEMIPHVMTEHVGEETANPYYTCHWQNCKNTGQTFRLRSNLVSHLQVHLGARQFRCDFNDCGRTFQSREQLVTHETTHGLTRHRVACEFPGCGRTFSRKDTVMEHYRARHLGDARFKCTFAACGKIFTKSSILRGHMRSHLTEKPYVCDFPNCDKAYADKVSLAKHREVHMVKPYACSFYKCGRKFVHIADYERHAASHMSLSHSGTVEECSRRDATAQTSNLDDNQGNTSNAGDSAEKRDMLELPLVNRLRADEHAENSSNLDDCMREMSIFDDPAVQRNVSSSRREQCNTLESSSSKGINSEGSSTKRNTPEGSLTKSNIPEGNSTKRNTTEGSSMKSNTQEGSSTKSSTQEGSPKKRNAQEGSSTKRNTPTGSATKSNNREDFRKGSNSAYDRRGYQSNIAKGRGERGESSSSSRDRHSSSSSRERQENPDRSHRKGSSSDSCGDRTNRRERSNVPSVHRERSKYWNDFARKCSYRDSPFKKSRIRNDTLRKDGHSRTNSIPDGAAIRRSALESPPIRSNTSVDPPVRSNIPNVLRVDGQSRTNSFPDGAAIRRSALECPPKRSNASVEPPVRSSIPNGPLVGSSSPDKPPLSNSVGDFRGRSHVYEHSPIECNIPDAPLVRSSISETPSVRSYCPDVPLPRCNMPGSLPAKSVNHEDTTFGMKNPVPSSRSNIPEKPSVRSNILDKAAVRNNIPDNPPVRSSIPDDPPARSYIPYNPPARITMPDNPLARCTVLDGPSRRSYIYNGSPIQTNVLDVPPTSNNIPGVPLVRSNLPDNPTIRSNYPDGHQRNRSIVSGHRRISSPNDRSEQGPASDGPVEKRHMPADSPRSSLNPGTPLRRSSVPDGPGMNGSLPDATSTENNVLDNILKNITSPSSHWRKNSTSDDIPEQRPITGNSPRKSAPLDGSSRRCSDPDSLTRKSIIPVSPMKSSYKIRNGPTAFKNLKDRNGPIAKVYAGNGPADVPQDENRIECPYAGCGMVFRNSGDRAVHRRQAHPR